MVQWKRRDTHSALCRGGSLCCGESRLGNGNHEDPNLKPSSSQVFALGGLPCLGVARFLAQNSSCGHLRPNSLIQEKNNRLLIFSVKPQHPTPNIWTTYGLLSPSPLKMSLCSTFKRASIKTAPDTKETVRKLLLLFLILANSIATIISYHQEFDFILMGS